MWGGKWVFLGNGLKLEMGRALKLEEFEVEAMWAEGWVGRVEHAERPARSRSPFAAPLVARGKQGKQDQPLHAERIRRSWEVKECAAMGPVVGFGGGREEVVVVAVDGVIDGFAPGIGAEGLTVFVLGDVNGLHESLRQVGYGVGGSGFYIAADHGGDEASQGGAEIAGGEVVAGEEVVEVFAEFLRGAGSGFFLGVVEAEAGMLADARRAATAAIRERKRTQGHAVLCTERGHRSLLRLSFGIADGREDRLKPIPLKQKRPGWSRGAVVNTDIVPQRQCGSS